ncbi:hypothetical protein SEVIR_5G138400v4 [Setaria viridis]
MSTVEMGWRAKVGTGLRPRSRTERRRLDPPSDNRQVSGKVLVYKHPGLHFGDIHKLTATHIDGLEEIVGDSKYDIFFQPLDHGLWLMKWPIAILMETCIGSHGTHSY